MTAQSHWHSKVDEAVDRLLALDLADQADFVHLMALEIISDLSDRLATIENVIGQFRRAEEVLNRPVKRLS